MDEETYFQKESLNNDIMNQGESSSFQTYPDSIIKDTQSENGFGNVNQGSLNNSVTSKSNDVEARVNVMPCDPSYGIKTEDQKSDAANGLFKNVSPCALSDRPVEPFKGSVRIVRLKAVSNSTAQDVNAMSCNIVSPPTGSLSKDDCSRLYVNQMKQETENITVTNPEAKYQVLTFSIPNKASQGFISSSCQEHLDANHQGYSQIFINSTISPSFEKENSCSSHNIADEPCHSPPVTKIPRFDKVSSHQSVVARTPLWVVNPSNSNNSNSMPTSNNSSYPSSAEEIQDTSANFESSSNLNESSQVMQRFVTSDGQVVFGYKDSNGEFHFYYPTLSERESHNEKERKRRSRVSEACASLRKTVPGLSDKTDKATVFEQAARYLKFLRRKYGTQFDQAYYEKYVQETS
ncbi:uncharacterized protein LOC118198428 isoform X2 [Stegodyphus dumicola]|uniref:uncharacterized protein LOC118198428 isoform X2 n=1 Tax=Stegodyphus dumicola TaxID=202533 RepID=UPI0015AB6573|nr:uncharacterized protein LOC118198428 isoform X2 [Stegodyphus dumicola]